MRNFLLIISLAFCVKFTIAQNKQTVSLNKINDWGITISYLPGSYLHPIELKIENPNQHKIEYKTGWETADDFRTWKNNLKISENTFVIIRVTNSKGETKHFQGNYLVGRNHTLPIICLRVNASEFFPPDGIYVGTIKKVGDENQKFEMSGKAFDKTPIRCFAEFIYGNQSVEATSCILKTFGGFTLGLAEKSLHLVADSTIGKKRFEYPFFANKPFNEFKHLVLRTSGSDQSSTRFKDICLSSIAADMNIDYMDYQPCSFYINDKYFGIINLREKINQDYLKYNHHTIEDSTDLGTADATYNKEYQQFMKWIFNYKNADQFKTDIKEKIDVEEYMNYIIWQSFLCNPDSRGNIRFWKAKNLDNKWRWIFYDSDLACAPLPNFLAEKLSSVQTEWYNPTWSTVIFNRLSSEKTTRDLLINQMCLLRATTIHPDTIQNRIEFFKKWIEPEIPYHSNRYPAKTSVQSWENHVEGMKHFFEKRNHSFHNEMCKIFSLDSNRSHIQIMSNFPDFALVSANESFLRFKQIDGLFYKGRKLRITANNRFPFTFTGWKDHPEINNNNHDIDLDRDQQWTAIYQKADWNNGYKDHVGIWKWGTQMNKKEELHWVELGNLSGEELNLNNWKFHFYEKELSLDLPPIKWPDNTSVVITNNKNKWQKQFPQFQGTIIELPISNQFLQEGTIMLSIEDKICDSLHFSIPDSLMSNNSKWLVISDLEGVHYKKWKDQDAPLKQFRNKKSIITPDFENNLPGALLKVGIALLTLGMIGFFIIKRRKSKD
jgi:CotH kinase protein